LVEDGRRKDADRRLVGTVPLSADGFETASNKHSRRKTEHQLPHLPQHKILSPHAFRRPAYRTTIEFCNKKSTFTRSANPPSNDAVISRGCRACQSVFRNPRSGISPEFLTLTLQHFCARRSLLSPSGPTPRRRHTPCSVGRIEPDVADR